MMNFKSKHELKILYTGWSWICQHCGAISDFEPSEKLVCLNWAEEHTECTLTPEAGKCDRTS